MDISQSSRNPHVLFCRLLLFMWVTVSHGITITPVKTTVQAKVTDTVIILPCNFTTNTYETPRIIWFRYRNGERRQIMKFENNRLKSYGELLNRVARGDRGALVLIRPTVQDSGKYSCEVEVEGESPNWVKADLYVEVESHVPVDVPGLISLICILWIISVFCAFILEGRGIDQVKRLCMKKKSSNQSGMTGCRCVPILIALGLTFTSTVCSATALLHIDMSDFNYYKFLSYGTGVAGVVILCGTYICVPRIKKWLSGTCFNETPVGTDELIMGVTTEHQNPKPGTSTSNIVRQEEEPLISHQESTVDKKRGEITTFKTVANPTDEKVTGMVSVSDKHVYVTTPSGLHRLDTFTDSTESVFSEQLDRKGELMMICKSKNRLLLLAENKETTSGDKCGVLTVRLKNNTIDKDFKTWRIACICAAKDNDYVYMTLPETQELVRTGFVNGILQTDKKIDTSVLKYPTCVCKNSRGQLIVTDSEKHDVFVFDESIGFVTSMKISVPKYLESELYGCNKLTIGADDRIYVTGAYNKLLFVFGADFRYERVIQIGMESSGLISCIMVHNHSLYVAYDDCIRVYPLKSLDNLDKQPVPYQLTT